MAEILEDLISVEDLKVFEQKYYEELRAEKGAVSESTQFQYACCLVRSGYAADVRKGIQMLISLLKTPSAGGGGQDAAQRDYLYFLAVGCAKVKEYVDSLKHVRKLLEMEPTNRQAKDLEKVVQKKMEREAYMGAAVAGGAVLAVGGIVGLAMALTKRH
ncbi:mitochondrial fission 1 protein-like [Amphibalanus amphitrite]|uniref:mitochondrial fission 1 protein-like n=1 Tax=Amphibalanus amphitrite TaxID=1232801 RepID=UPI001C901221|nr:mitochondrial fission 1 protein-like [Amphibalanus amphitrite]XP_043236016.1 mitochondrial fission 1 protein-like [Amphibalanus amphitrite]XP_043236017.1 mitochondrial fission 1 protein-like [Amphibalanus amphitrite]XP_043236018.1 mitochondrial fission 1 protein-like [Amphibalanus amphitrite]XP_043236019.1 mitochondrial fission 1 protein-like [Amphibalanus amphitrite]XP_043236020.1 mitochondrial fission 1 protein-like [Amphibalanus amphitrite]XP_043236021.1 mitochondrial fission 1 protein-